MTASVLKQNPNTKRFKRTLIYFYTDTQYANFRGNLALYQATKRDLNSRKTVKNDEKLKKKTYLVLVNLLINYICMKKIMQQTSQ